MTLAIGTPSFVWFFSLSRSLPLSVSYTQVHTQTYIQSLCPGLHLLNTHIHIHTLTLTLANPQISTHTSIQGLCSPLPPQYTPLFSHTHTHTHTHMHTHTHTH